MKILVQRDGQRDLAFDGELIASGFEPDGMTECDLYVTTGGKYVVAERQAGVGETPRYAATVATTPKEVVAFLTRERRFSDAAKELLRQAVNHDPDFERLLFERVD